MKKVIEVEGLTIVGEVEDLDKLRQVITRGSNQFFEKVAEATEEEAWLVEYWTRMGHYAFRLLKGMDTQIKEQSR